MNFKNFDWSQKACLEMVVQHRLIQLQNRLNWRRCYELAGIDPSMNDGRSDDGQEVKVVEYWMKVMKVCDAG